MTDVAPSNSEVDEPVRKLRDTQIFLKMAAIELRRLSEHAPDIAIGLRNVAQKLDIEAEDLIPNGCQNISCNGGEQCFTSSK